MTDWIQRWENNETGWHEAKPHPLLIEYHKHYQLTEGDTVFVPLCGASVDMFFLAECGYRVVGVELSDKACRSFFETADMPYTTVEVDGFTCYQSDKVMLYCGDFFDLTAEMLGEVKAVYDRAAFIAIAPQLRYAYLHQLRRVIPGQFTMLLIGMYYQNERVGPPYNCPPKLIQTVLKSCFSVERLTDTTDTSVCQHLTERGFVNLHEEIYWLTTKDTRA